MAPITDTGDSGVRTPSWNGEQRYLSTWLDDLERWLPQQDPNYHLLITRGTIQLKHQTAVPNAEFATDLATTGNVVAGTYGQPTPSRNATRTALDDDLKGRFVVAPDAINATDFKMLQAIISTITVVEFADELRDEANESGRELLRQQREACAAIRPEAKTTLEDEYDDFVKSGISELHPTSLSRFKTGLVNRNKAQGNLKSDAQMASALIGAARKLGDLVALQVDLEMKGCDGTLLDTNRRLRSLFTDLAEREARQRKHDGRAMLGRDADGGRPPKHMA
jgi:hypothetical protein